MKAVFMGTPDFAVGALRRLYEDGHEILAVVTQPDKPQGRKMVMTPPAVKAEALRLGLPVYQPKKIRDAESIAYLEKLAPDVIVVAAFGQIIPKAILDLPKYGCLNIHASLLPKYRGAAPIQWAIIDGEKETGVTIMRMDEGLDTGDMLTKCIVPITEEETGGSLFDKLSTAGAELLSTTLKRLETEEIPGEKQPAESPTAYAGMIKRDTGRIDWTKDAAYLERLVRGLTPWPGCSTGLHDKQLKLWKCRVGAAGTEGAPGTVCEVKKDALCVQTGDGVLEILELQLEGKKRMDAATFLRGYKVETGTVLG